MSIPGKKISFQEMAVNFVQNVVASGFELSVSNDWKEIVWARKIDSVIISFQGGGWIWKHVRNGVQIETGMLVRRPIWVIQGILDNIRLVE